MKPFTNVALLMISFLVITQLHAQLPELSSVLTSNERPLELTQLRIEVEVVGNVATTTYDMTFYNPNKRVLEGELSVPLNDGQEISRYALEVNGKLREGVIVEKIKARQTFEAVVRQNIDPGLVSRTKGNFFKTRIYPIPAEGHKRMAIGMVETLSSGESDYHYTLPVSTPIKIGEFDLSVKVFKGEGGSQQPGSGLGNVQFDTKEDVHYLTFKREDYTLSESLKFSVPRFSSSDYQVFTENIDDDTYFYLTARPPVLQKASKDALEKVSVYWDRSHSASARNSEQELSLLSQYLESLPGIKMVDLHYFNYQTGTPQTFSIGQDTEELIRCIRELENDGATRLDQLSFSASADEVLLFTDAVNTIGEDFFNKSAVPIYCISSGSGANYNLLRKVASQSDGIYIDLNKVSIEDALEQMSCSEEKLLSITSNDLEEVYPKIPETVGNTVEVAGILKSADATITLHYGKNGKTTQTQSFQIRKAIKDVPISRIWAGKKIKYLEWDFDRNQELILELGRRHHIVTRNASLLVLDRVEDYVEHEIVPPAELREEYDRLMAQKQPDNERSPEQIQSQNIESLNRLISWYENPRPPKTSKKAERSGDVNLMEVPDEEEVEVELDVEVAEERVIEDVVFSEEAREEVLYESAPQEVASDLYGLTAGVQMDSNNGGSNPSSIKVLSWMPDAPYMTELRNKSGEDLIKTYYQLKKDHKTRPSFYVQVADLFFQRANEVMAAQVLSNVIELELENPELLKVVAKRFMAEGLHALSIDIFQEVKSLRPEEPQSYRDLAGAYLAAGQYQEALDLYVYILDHDWERFQGIKPVILNELNHLISMHRSEVSLKGVNKDYIHHMPLDVRIVIDWSSNDNDIDLWVIDPNGEKCFYSHPRTQMGGKISADFTQGYGPEEFSLKEAERGTYTVFVNYFGESRQRITGPVTVYATLYTGYGTPDEKSEHLAVQLVDNKDTQQIGQLEFER